MIKTIRGRITFWAVLVLLCSICIVAVSNIYYLGSRLNAKVEDALEARAEAASHEIDTQFMRIIGMLEGVSSSISANGGVKEEEARVILDTFYNANPELLNVYLGTKNGHFFQANEAEMPENYDARKRPWYIKAVENRDVTITNPYIDNTTGGMVATVSMPINLRDQIVGVVAIDISVDTIVQIVESAKYEDGAYGLLIDSDGNVVSHKNQMFNPTTEGLTYASDVMPNLLTVLEDAKGSVVEAMDYNGVESYFSSAVVDGCDWTFAISIPTSVVKANIIHSMGISAFVAALAAIFSIAVCMLLIKKELDPLKEMKPAITRIAEGDFTETIDFSKRDDEVGALQNELSSLVARLNDIISQEKYILGEMAQGNLMVNDMTSFPGELNDISEAVNAIKSQLNTLITEIQFSAITLQSTAMGFTGTAEPEEMQAIFAELSAEANDLMEKANAFKTN